MAEELSKKIIIVLLILTILVSIVGTWTVLTSAEQGVGLPQQLTNSGKGEIVLKILPQPETGGVPNG